MALKVAADRGAALPPQLFTSLQPFIDLTGPAARGVDEGDSPDSG